MPDATTADDYGHNVALAYAIRSRDRHGVTWGGVCQHCRTPWPCYPFWLAHHAVLRLAATPEPPAGETNA